MSRTESPKLGTQGGEESPQHPACPTPLRPTPRLWLWSAAGKGALWCLAPHRYLSLMRRAELKMEPVLGRSLRAGPARWLKGDKFPPEIQSLVLVEGQGLSRPSAGPRVAFSCSFLPSVPKCPFTALPTIRRFRSKSAAENKAGKNCLPSWAVYSDGGRSKADKIKVYRVIVREDNEKNKGGRDKALRGCKF